MDQTRSTTIGALVLIGGVSAAMIFRKPDPAEPEGPARGLAGRFEIEVADRGQGNDVVLRDQSSFSRSYPPPPDRASQRSQGRLAEIRDSEQRADSVGASNSQPPPTIPKRYGGLMSTRNNQSGASLGDARLMTPRRRVTGRREHRIRNLDTLESIALRYYDDKRFADAIYQANRDQLPSKHLLPLNVTLRLPTPDELRRLAANQSEPHARHSQESYFRELHPPPRTTLGSVR